MAKDLICIRVLQHDTEDQIRIGRVHYAINMDITVKTVIQKYEDESAWCGGFAAACEKYYKRIAIVDADTLEVMRSIYNRKEAQK